MTTNLTRRIGTAATLTKQLSEADIALFVLVTGDAPLDREEPPDPRAGLRQTAPLSLLAALLASAAARHAARPEQARFLSQSVRFAEPALTDDTITATAEIVGYDEAERALRIEARCANQEGRQLADGQFLLRDE